METVGRVPFKRVMASPLICSNRCNGAMSVKRNEWMRHTHTWRYNKQPMRTPETGGRRHKKLLYSDAHNV